MGLSLYAIDSHTHRKRRHPSAAIAWFISLLLVPYVAVPVYFLVGRRKLETQRLMGHSFQHHKFSKTPSLALPPLHSIASALGLREAVATEALVIHQDGPQAWQALLSCIASANQTLEICSFLISRDSVGNDIQALLIQKAKQGVRIRVLVDGLGYYMGGLPPFKALRQAGVAVVLFAPPLQTSLQGRTNFRNHRKLAVADAVWMWSGGRNFANPYFNLHLHPHHKPWVDLSFDVRGAIAQHAQDLFNHDWAFATHQTPINQSAHPNTPSIQPDRGARLVPSGPDQAEDTVYMLLIAACFTAQSHIQLVTPYFIPDQSLLTALEIAALRGVRIDLLLPKTSNHTLADIARCAPLRDLARAGACIWLHPSMLHAKAIVIDDTMALVGSANLDERSLFLNYELMVAFYEEQAVAGFTQWLTTQIQISTAYQSTKTGWVRDIGEGFVRWVAFQL